MLCSLTLRNHTPMPFVRSLYELFHIMGKEYIPTHWCWAWWDDLLWNDRWNNRCQFYSKALRKFITFSSSSFSAIPCEYIAQIITLPEHRVMRSSLNPAHNLKPGPASFSQTLQNLEKKNECLFCKPWRLEALFVTQYYPSKCWLIQWDLIILWV